MPLDVPPRTSVAGMRTNPVLTQLGAYPIAALQERARAMRAAGEPLLDFSIGDPREPTPTFVPEALRRSIPAVSQYPTTSGLPELRRSVAAYVLRRFGVEVNPDTQVLPTAGSKEAHLLDPAGVCGPCRAHRRWCGRLPATRSTNEGHCSQVLRASRSPSPETSSCDPIRSRTMSGIAPHWCGSTIPTTRPAQSSIGAGSTTSTFGPGSSGAWFCSDECYVDIYEGEPPPSILQVAGPGSPGALSYMSLSKRSGMTGYRTAAIVGDPDGIATLKDLRTSTGTASPEFVQKAAITAWDDDDHTAERRAIFADKRAILRTAFEDTGHEVVASHAGIYIWARVGDDVAVAERLLASGIVVSPGRAFGSGGEGFIRLALIPTLDETQQATEVLKACLTEM